MVVLKKSKKLTKIATKHKLFCLCLFFKKNILIVICYYIYINDNTTLQTKVSANVLEKIFAKASASPAEIAKIFFCVFPIRILLGRRRGKFDNSASAQLCKFFTSTLTRKHKPICFWNKLKNIIFYYLLLKYKILFYKRLLRIYY